MKSKTEEKLPEIRRRPMVLPVNCSMCLFHKRMAVYPRPCQELGVPGSSDPCAKFAPDPSQMGEDPGRALRALATSHRPLLHAAALVASRRLRRTRFAMGDRVFFLVVGDDYLSNYASGSVVSATTDKLIIAGREGHTALLDESSLLDVDGWFAARKRLVAAGRINDPNGGLRKITIKSTQRLIAYVPEELAKTTKGGRYKNKTKSKRGRPAKTPATEVFRIN